MTPAKTQPALLGGVAIGVLSALPVINLANCCCAWILFGGALAAFLMQQNHPEPIQIGDGAIVGLLAGMIGAFVWLLVSIPLSIMMAPIQSEMARRTLSRIDRFEVLCRYEGTQFLLLLPENDHAQALSRGEELRIAICAEPLTPGGKVPPCGACLQVMAEFGTDELPVLLCAPTGEVETRRLGELMPALFRFPPAPGGEGGER